MGDRLKEMNWRRGLTMSGVSQLEELYLNMKQTSLTYSLMLAAGIFLFGLTFSSFATAQGSIPAPGHQPSGLAYDRLGELLYVSNLSGDRTIYIVNPTTGEVIDSFLAPSPGGLDGKGNPNGLAMESWLTVTAPIKIFRYIYVSDIDGVVYRIYDAKFEERTIVSSFTLPFRGGAIAYDYINDELYISDHDSETVRVTDHSGTHIRTFDSGLRPAGMTYDPATEHLWVIDEFNNKIYEMTANGKLIRSCEGPRVPGIQGLGGITMVGSTLYVAEVSDPNPFDQNDIPGTIYILDPETLTCEYINKPPVADAGADQHVSFGDTVVLDASGSWDEDDPFEDLTFRWICVQGCDDWCESHEQTIGPIPLSDRVVLDTGCVVWSLEEDKYVREECPFGCKAPECFFVPGRVVALPQPTTPNFCPTCSFVAGEKVKVGSIIFQVVVTDSQGSMDTDEVVITVFEDLDHAVFVSSDPSIGDNANPGTMQAPVADIETAIALAGAVMSKDIYVQEGDYKTNNTLIVGNHMSMYGGFSRGLGWTRTATLPTRILSTSTTALNIAGIRFPTTIDGFHIKSADGSSPAAWDFGGNSTVIYIADSNDLLQITNNVIEAGMGGTAGAAEDHTGSAAEGEPGEDGDDGFVDYGGGGGRGGKGTTAGSDGGDGAACDFDCVADDPFGIACGADDGQKGAGDFFGGKGGIACDGLNGEDGRTGFTGAGGEGGAAEGTIIDSGFTHWRGGSGSGGTEGSWGGGGGGGAAGDGTTLYYWITVPCPPPVFACPVPIPYSVVFGGGGGGGGEGGAGGQSGNGGRGGGASFSIFVTDNSSPWIRHNYIVTAGGGDGSKGGDGQQGGPGGPGGEGGSGVPLKSDDGGDGGRGGKGGDGGGGGGGAGGASCGIYEALESKAFLCGNSYGIGPAGQGGEGGWPNGEPGSEGIRGARCPDELELKLCVCEDVLPDEFTIIPADIFCPTEPCDITFGITITGSDVVMTLITPSGRIIDRNTIDPDVIHDKGPTFESYTIINAEQGAWTIQLFGADVPPEGERVALSVTSRPTNNPPIAICRDVTVAAGPDCKANASIDDGSSDPDSGPVSITQTPNGPFQLGETSVTLVITDDEGLSDTCQAKVTVVDQTCPDIVCPDHVSVPADANCQAQVSLNASATDSCDSSISITSDAPATYPLGSTKVTFTATDSSGNSSSCWTTVDVFDQTPPAIICPANITLECPATPADIGSATAADSCDSSPVIGNGVADIDTFPLGDSFITWSAYDDSGNTSTCQQIVTVVDTTPPVITLNGPAQVSLECATDTYTELGATATDSCDPNVTVGIGGDTVDTSTCGTYVVTYEASDASGNVAQVTTRTVIVHDLTPPVPDVADLPDVTGECSAEITSWPRATDSCAGTVTGTTSDPLSYTEQGTYTVTWTYEDGSGNITTQTQSVIVKDITPPSIESLAASPDVLWPPNHKMVLIQPTVVATDNCDPPPTIELISITMNEGDETNTFDPNYDSTLGDGHTVNDIEVDDDGNIYLRAERSGTGTGRIYTLTYTATDAAGNISFPDSTTVTVPHDQR